MAIGYGKNNYAEQTSVLRSAQKTQRTNRVGEIVIDISSRQSSTCHLSKGQQIGAFMIISLHG